MEPWAWIVIIVFALGGLTFLSKSTRSYVKTDQKIRDMLGYVEFYAGFVSEIRTALENQNLLDPVLLENFQEVQTKLGLAFGMIHKAQLAMDLQKRSGNAEERENRLREAMQAVNQVIQAIPDFDRATTVLLDHSPAHPAVDKLVAEFRRKKKNIMNGYSAKPVEYK